MENFRKLGLIEPIIKALENEKYVDPTLIQEKTIPAGIEGKDIIAESATGTGKTLAFAAGIIQNCEKGKGIQALILTPTRELAEQITINMRKFSRYKPMNVISVYGGVSINPQISGLYRADVVVATPGRLLDHVQRRTINLSRVKTLVLDEADKMLDMGFIDDVVRIIKECPKERQTLLFSATIDGEIRGLVNKYMHNPIKISVGNRVDPSKMQQTYYDISDSMKFSLLVHLLKTEKPGMAMIFCNTQRTTEFVAKNLRMARMRALAIHGGYSQSKRSKTLEEFHSKEAKVLVCTDVAARGIDVKDVSYIYNYDAPLEEKQYLHRIGRTARAGEEGMVINLISPRDHENFRRVMYFLKAKMDKKETPKFERINVKMENPMIRNRGHEIRRPSWGRR